MMNPGQACDRDLENLTISGFKSPNLVSILERLKAGLSWGLTKYPRPESPKGLEVDHVSVVTPISPIWTGRLLPLTGVSQQNRT